MLSSGTDLDHLDEKMVNEDGNVMIEERTVGSSILTRSLPRGIQMSKPFT
jgi:hypothetical protein